MQGVYYNGNYNTCKVEVEHNGKKEKVHYITSDVCYVYI